MCACGTTITAPSLAVSAPYIEGHNATPAHYAWRLRNDLSRERPTAAEPGFRDDGLCPQTGPGRSRASAAAVRGES